MTDKAYNDDNVFDEVGGKCTGYTKHPQLKDNHVAVDLTLFQN